MKLGIIGSSYSTGNHVNFDGTHTPEFSENLHEHLVVQGAKDLEIYSYAQGGRGSEMYLHCLTHMKKMHDVDHVLVEIINDRSPLQIDIPETEELYTNLKDQRHAVLKRNGLKKYQSHITEKDRLWKYFGNKKMSIAAANLGMILAEDKLRFEWWYTFQIRQTIDLCKLLKIKATFWNCHGHSPSSKDASKFEEFIYSEIEPNFPIVEFPTHWSAKVHFHNVDPENYLCSDLVHLNTDASKLVCSTIATNIMKQETV